MSTSFNSNGAATEHSGIFGLGFPAEEAALVIIPIPWEATCSYGKGTSRSPAEIIDASAFVELYDYSLGEFYIKGIGSIEIDNDLLRLSDEAAKLAVPIIGKGGVINDDSSLLERKQEVDKMCEQMNHFAYEKCKKYLDQNKIVGVLGGDHSVCFGSIKAHLEKYPNMGVLQIDAHCDLRNEFENLKYSHASIMLNILNQTKLPKLVQVGIRGYCIEEYENIQNSNGRVVTFFDLDIANNPWNVTIKNIINILPQEVYISFDIDGLDQSNCPSTGTPMPGGLSYNQSLLLLSEIIKSGRKIVGFDLVEVVTGNKGAKSWDAVCAANLLYKLCGAALSS